MAAVDGPDRRGAEAGANAKVSGLNTGRLHDSLAAPAPPHRRGTALESYGRQPGDQR
jgi:hypothetical protein